MSSVLATVEVDIKLEQIESYFLANELIRRRPEGKPVSKEYLINLLDLLGYDCTENGERFILKRKELE